MVKHRRSNILFTLMFMLIALLIWLALMYQFRLDDSFITYRYARNAANGLGLVYNSGDAVLSTTAPLYALTLAALSKIIPDFHTLGGLIGTLSIGLGAVVIFRLVDHPVRIWAGLLYVISTPLWLALGMETPLWILLVLAAVALADAERWSFAGLLVGLAVLVRPDAALPGVLLGGAALATSVMRLGTSRQWWRSAVSYGGLAAVPVLIFGLWAFVTYGSPFPATLGAKGAQAIRGVTGLGLYVGTFDGLALIVGNLVQQSPLYILVGLLAVLGLRARLPWTVILIVLWGVLHLLAYAVLQIAPYRWYYAPLLPGVILLSAYGLDGLYQRTSRAIAVSVAVLALLAPATSFAHIAATFAVGAPPQPMLPIVDWDAYRQVGDWLRTQTPTDATVGVAEVGQVGFYAERWMTDYLGLLQPDVADMLKRGDLYSWLVGYAPDYLVFQRFRGIGLVLYNLYIQEDRWFIASYAPVVDFDDPRYAAGPVTIFERVGDKRPMLDQAVQAEYGGLKLLSLAVEQTSINDSSARVRLDWQVIAPLPPAIHLAVKILDAPGLPAFDADYQTDYWEGTFSTWHTLILPDNLPPGDYPLLVSVGDAGIFNEQTPGVFTVQP